MSYAGIHGNPGSSPWLVSTLSCNRLSPNQLNSYRSPDLNNLSSTDIYCFQPNQAGCPKWIFLSCVFLHLNIGCSGIFVRLCICTPWRKGSTWVLWELRNALVLPFHCWCATTHGPYMNQAVCSLDSLFGSASVLHLSTQTPSPLSTAPSLSSHCFNPPCLSSFPSCAYCLVSPRCRLGRFPCFEFTKA